MQNLIFPFCLSLPTSLSRKKRKNIFRAVHIEIGLSLEYEKPISLPREEIRVKLATGLTLFCAHLASLAEIQGKAMAEDGKKDYDTNCPEFAPWVVTHLKVERTTRFPPLYTRVL